MSDGVLIVIRAVIIGLLPSLWGWYATTSWQWWALAIGAHVTIATIEFRK